MALLDYKDIRRFAVVANTGEWHHDWHWEKTKDGYLTCKGARAALENIVAARDEAMQRIKNAQPLIVELTKALSSEEGYWPEREAMEDQ